MTSKKTPANKRTNKRTNLPRQSDHAKSFLKDWERLSHSGRYDMTRLKEVMLLLIANDEPLPAEWLDHALKHDWEGYRECHVGGDFLLIYKIDASVKPEMIVFTRAGTHSELFSS
jgi:mRNA interferase YafQ